MIVRSYFNVGPYFWAYSPFSFLYPLPRALPWAMKILPFQGIKARSAG